MNMTLLIVDWSHVWLVTGVGFIMVFILLVFLTYTLDLFGKFMHKLNNKQINNTKKVSEPAHATAKADDEQDIAAIAMALHLYYNSVHDADPPQITIKRIQKQQTPWSNKIYGMNNLYR